MTKTKFVMSDILIFTPKNETDTKKNLEDFIEFCKNQLTAFSPDFCWDDNLWPQISLFFGNLDSSRGQKDQHDGALQQPLLDFAKAYVRYTLSSKRKTRARYEGTIFKCLEKALLESRGFSNISMLTPSILDRAAELARERYTPSSCYHIGRKLQQLAEFVSHNNLTPNHLDWKNPNSRVVDTVRTGLKAQKLRDQKLPSDIALRALAEVFASNPSDSGDIFITSTCALLLCVPSRISEVLSLHENCEVYETRRDGCEAYGIRFLPGKGAPPQIKWVPTAMVSLAQEAIRRLRAMTNEGRRIAKWYEDNPDKFYRHSQCPAVLDGECLTVNQRIRAVGYYDKKIFKKNLTTLAEIQKEVIKRQPKGFPFFDKDRGLKFSDALFCFQRNQIAPKHKTSKILVYRPAYCNLLERISRTDGFSDGNFFDWHGYRNEDGTSIKVTSHQFRHLLNTMAQRGGMSQIDIARWSGRVEVKQNRVYDHMSEFEIVDMIRNRDSDLMLDGPLEELRKKISEKLPIDSQSFNILAFPTAHITEVGYCIHDYTMSPCQKHLDCLNCSEQVCVKGDKRIKDIQGIYEKNKALLEKMDSDISDGISGVDRWYEHTKMTLQRVENLLDIMTDSTVPNGSIIKLHNPQEFSPMKRAMEARTLKATSDESLSDKVRFLMEE